jgi:hypothetical protein
MESMINGSKITVERKEEEKGMTILEGLINSFIIKENSKKEDKKNEKEGKK